MRKLNPPELASKDVLDACISNVLDTTLCSSIRSNISIFTEAENEYKCKAEREELHTISSVENVTDVITKEKMKFLYDKMVKKSNIKAREYYDLLLASSFNCPFCGYGISTTLDHFLPKASYSVYAVTPINLVPCCKDCNTTKLSTTTEDDLLFIHPYFDNVDDSRWLYCDIKTFPETVAFRFKVVQPSNWTETKYKRMKYHFIKFNLNRLFTGYTTSEFSDSLFQLKNLLLKSDSEAVKEDLNLKYESCNENLQNHWKTAMYDALRSSEDFINWLDTRVKQVV